MQECSIHGVIDTETGVCMVCFPPSVVSPEAATGPVVIKNEGPENSAAGIVDPLKKPEENPDPNNVDPLPKPEVIDPVPTPGTNQPSAAGGSPNESKSKKKNENPTGGNPEEDPKKGGENHRSDGDKLKHVIQSELKDSSIESGGAAILGNRINNVTLNSYIQNEHQERKDSRILLFERSEPMSFADYDESNKEYDELVLSLKKERVLLLGDLGDGNSFSAAQQIAKSLRIKNEEENARLLSLNAYTSEKTIYIRSFCFARDAGEEGAGNEAVIVIDATKDGFGFADSLVNPENSFISHFPSILKRNGLFLICMLSAETLNEWKGHTRKKMFPFHILEDREVRVPESENEFESKKAETILNDDDDLNGPILKTVLFVASFFPNLTTGDFNDLVGKWLAIEPEVERPVLNADGAEQAVKKIVLENIWSRNPHIFTEQCFIFQERNDQGRRIVNFESEAYSKYFKDRFESRYFVFFDKKISEILDFSLVFHPSEKVSSHSIDILTDYVPQIEDKYTEWLIGVFQVLERVENLEELRDFFKVEDVWNKHFYYTRLARLFRAMFRDSHKPLVSAVMEKLVQNKCYKSVLILIKRLQFAPNFDTSYWLKQLLERGDNANETIAYVFSVVENANIGEVLERLKVWLPDDATDVNNYSKSNKAALSLIADYYFYQTHIFDENLYGLEPTQFPLFVFDCNSPAENQIDLIVKYLVHPANSVLLSDEFPFSYDVALILTRWADILFSLPHSRGPVTDSPAAADTTALGENAALTNTGIMDRLLKQTCRNSDEKQQEEILFVWRNYLEELAFFIEDRSFDWKLRQNATQKRKMIKNLVEKFKKCQRSQGTLAAD